MKLTKLLQLTVLFLSFETLQALPDFHYYFDNLDNSLVAEDAGTWGFNMNISKASHITAENPKFGEGSLLIQQGTRAATTGFYTDLSSVPDLNMGTKQLSISAWICMVDDSPLNIIQRATLDTGSLGRFLFRIDRKQRLSFSIDKKNAISEWLDFPPHGEWFHVAVTFQEGEVNFYYNGELFSTTVLGVSEIAEVSGDGSFSLGLHGQPGVQFDDVAFMGDTVLTEEEIRQIFTVGLKQYKDGAE